MGACEALQRVYIRLQRCRATPCLAIDDFYTLVVIAGNVEANDSELGVMLKALAKVYSHPHYLEELVDELLARKPIALGVLERAMEALGCTSEGA